MKTILRIVLIILTLCFGIASVYHEFGRQEVGLFDQLKQIPFVIICLLIILLFVVDYRYYKTNKTSLQFLPTCFALLFFSVTVCKKITRNNINKESTLLRVVNQAGAKNVIEFDFKRSNNYVLTEFNLLGRDVYYGKYKKNNDSIYLLTNSYNGEIKSMPKFGVISNDTLFWYMFDTMLIEKQN